MRKNRADAVHIMYSCAAFANNGIEVQLLTPLIRRKEYKIKKNEIFSLYDVPENFAIKELPPQINDVATNDNGVVRAWKRLQKFFSHLYFFLTNFSIFSSSGTILYSKCFISTMPYILLKKVKLHKIPIVFELPIYENKLSHKIIAANSDFLIGKPIFKDNLINRLKDRQNKLIIPSARFQTDYLKQRQIICKQSVRKKNGIGVHDKCIVYGGKTGPNSVRLVNFVKIATKLPEFKFLVIGANEAAKVFLENFKIPNLLVFSFQPYQQFIELIGMGDILIGNYEDNSYNRYFLIPGKSGPYLASGIPVIFSDLPSLRERFSEEIIYFAKPENIEDWVEKIHEIIDHPEKANRKAQKAREFVQSKTFTKSAESILKQLNDSLYQG